MKMFKSLTIAAMLLMAGVVKAHALTETLDVNFSTCAVFTVNVASATTNNGATPLFSATLVGATTGFLSLQEDRDSLFTQNLSTFATVFCEVGLSSTSANGDLALTQPGGLSTSNGKVLSFRINGISEFVPFRVIPRNRDKRVLIPWCVNNGATGSAPVQVTQCRR